MRYSTGLVCLLAVLLQAGASGRDDSFDRLVKMAEDYESDAITLSNLYSEFHSYRNALDELPKPEWCMERYSREYCNRVDARRKWLSDMVLKEQAPDDGSAAVIARLKEERLVILQEKDLPREWTAAGKERKPESPHPPGVTVVSSSCASSDCLAVAVSQDIDPRGEVSSGGYWAYLSSDKGTIWHGPYYLGFAEQFPYVVRENGSLPPFNGGELQVAADIREVDEDSIYFPPVGLRAKRVKEGIYLQISRAGLVRDSDGDGLTDLYEEKIASDPHSADTDHDGIGDASDAEPLTAWKAEHSEEEEVILAAMQDMIFGNAVPIQQTAGVAEAKEGCVPGGMKFQNHPYTSGRVLFIESDHPILNSYDLPVRTVVLSSEAAALYNKKFGPTYMLSIGEVVFNRDHTRAYFKYDFAWEGGSFSARKVRGKWVAKREGNWVT